MEQRLTQYKQELYDGQGFSKKLLRKGIIQLRPILDSDVTKRDTNLSFRAYKDKETETMRGIPIGQNPDGTYKFKQIIVRGTRFFNLELMQDAKEWDVIKDHETVKGSKHQNMRPLFYIFDPEQEANTNIGKFNRFQKVYDYINDLSGNNLRSFGRLFGINPDHASDSIIKSTLLDEAFKNPADMLEKMDNKEKTEVMIILERAISVGLIQETLEQGFLYKGGIQLGRNKNGVIESLINDKQMLHGIDNESKDLDEKHYLKKEEKAGKKKKEEGQPQE